MGASITRLDEYKKIVERTRTATDSIPAQKSNQEDVVDVAELMLDMFSFLEGLKVPGLEDLGKSRRKVLLSMVSGKDVNSLIAEIRPILTDLMAHVKAKGKALEHTEGLDLLSMSDPVQIISTVYQRYPEMGWLTGDITITPEASHSRDDDKKTIGEQIFPHMTREDVVEFDRTAVGILNLIWVLQGDYEAFTQCQKAEVKLSRESFNELRRYTQAILPEVEDLRAMIIYMVINDLGKIPQFIEKVRTKRASKLALDTITLGEAVRSLTAYTVKKDLGLIKQISDKLDKDLGAESVDHDVALVEGLQTAPEESPSFLNLAGKDRENLLTGLQARFNVGQFIQGENVPASLAGLHDINQRGLECYLLHALYDIAGAAGQFVQNGSAVMTEPLYQGFKLAIESINELLQGKSLVEVYDSFLNKKMGPCGLDIAEPQQRAIARLACMLRYSTKEEVAELQDVFANLHPNIQAILKQELNKNGVDDGFATLIYYSPPILANTIKSHKGNRSEALNLGLTTLARIYQEARIAIKNRQGSGVYTLMAKNLGDLAAKDPTKLQNAKLGINQIGKDAELTIGEHSMVDVDKFAKLGNLSEIPGEKVAVIGMGGGSDGCQAAILGKLLEKNGKIIPAVISVRESKPTSQGKSGEITKPRTVENYRREIIPGKVYEISSETTGSGRFLENLPAQDVPMFLVIDHLDGTLQDDIKAVLDAVGGVQTVIGLDTGGDALMSVGGEDVAHATPDQDVRVLRAIDSLSVQNKLSCEMAVGVDSPDDAEQKMLDAEASYFAPSPDEAKDILNYYKNWGLDGSKSDEGLYGKTPFAFQMALKGMTGIQCLDLPKANVTSPTNPWRTFVHIQPATGGIFFMDAQKHLSQL